MQQLQDFANNGFLLLRNFTDLQTCTDILQKAKLHFKQQIPPFESEQEYLQIDNNKLTIRRLRQVYQRETVFQKWMTNSEIRPFLSQLLQDEPILTLAHHNSIMTKTPKESSITSWHQDRRYWHFQNDNLISIWLSLGEEYLENGLLEFIPGSHKINFHKEQFDAMGNFLQTREDNQKIIAQRAHQNLFPGDVVLFHCRTLHYANRNTTEHTKFSFVYTVRGKKNLPIQNTRSDSKEIAL
ncbi:MAG: phytanoyl-CoA dioxygenase family protein [Spirochaetota bacterium]